MQGKIPFFKNSIGDIKLATLVDGKLSTKIPTKEEGYTVEEIVCDKGAIAEWDKERWGIFVSNLTESETICTISFNSDFIRLKNIVQSNADNMEQLLLNVTDVNRMVSSLEALQILGNSSLLKKEMKESSNYNLDLAKKIANSDVLSAEEKYELGLPFKAYTGGSHVFSANLSACASWNVVTFETRNYSRIYIASYKTNTTYFGITVSNRLETCAMGSQTGSISANISHFETTYVDVSWGAHHGTVVEVGEIYVY